MTSTLTPSQLREELAHFHGSEVFYRHPLVRSVVYTEGVRYLAEKAEAFWLIDAIASYFGSPVMHDAIAADDRLAGMQFWTLSVTGSEAELSMVADVGEPPFICQPIGFTDFPLEEIDLWAGFNGEFWTLYLPSEH